MKSHPLSSAMHHADPPGKARTWRFYAGLTFGVAMLLVLGLLAAFWVYRQSLINTYTARAPVPIPTVEVRPEDRQALNDKWNRFLVDLNSQRPIPPLTMSAPEINAFMSMIPPMRDRVHASIEGDLLRFEFSAPLDEVGLKGRYANGVSFVRLKLDQDGLAKLELVSARLNGKELPRWFQNQINKQPSKNPDMDLVQQILTDAQIGRHLESIEIRDGMVVFNPIHSP